LVLLATQHLDQVVAIDRKHGLADLPDFETKRRPLERRIGLRARTPADVAPELGASLVSRVFACQCCETCRLLHKHCANLRRFRIRGLPLLLNHGRTIDRAHVGIDQDMSNMQRR